MIFDSIENFEKYLSVNPRFKKALEFIKGFNPDTASAGRHEIEGDAIYANVAKYTTVPAEERKWECHKKYIDIQYVARGREIMGWRNISELPGNTPYNEEKDCSVFYGDGGIDLKTEEGYFAIFFPEDIHRPQCLLDRAEDVVKVIVKVAV